MFAVRSNRVQATADKPFSAAERNLCAASTSFGETHVEVPDDNIVIAESSTPWYPGVTDPTPIITYWIVYREAAREFYDAIPEVREAALAIAVDIFQSRVAPGGQIQAVDFTPGPYRLGRSLFTRVSGLLARWTDTSSLVG
jgi:hypothetical protein